ncbi:hypothetical protein [Marinicella gelatinilytica]|uniref:hypothetical protein n=1 Tax=Marinicella gelatinilytica TaxID=2996017 RepID=UPI0022609EE5|nr:hypothetical protein [Marinicella gelatinilytica]MCX7544433.1 hypothetical protein [Marinicella gelatinilytica]
MKKLLITGILFTVSFTINAQVLSESDLAAVNVDNINIIEQMRLESENTFSGGSPFVTVGDNSQCDYFIGSTRIQDAIDDNHTEIRIVEGTYKENIVIDNKNVQLLGGYETCSDANNDIYNLDHVYISPNSGSGKPAIKITGDSTRNFVRMRSIFLSLGEAHGGLYIPDADLGLEIESSIIAINKGGYGGGLSVVNGRTDIYTDDLRIYLNRASVVGGGLYCSGSNNHIIMETKDIIAPIIFQNEATNGDGGGAYISNGCNFTSYSGNDDDTSGISNNEAAGDGGGLYATSGAKVYLNGNRYCNTNNICYGDNERPVNLSGNTADSDQSNIGSGGAIYATGVNTAVYGNNLKINLNDANGGNAATIAEGALFQTQTTYNNGAYGHSNSCWANGRCNQFVGNNSTNINGGGAFQVNSGGQLDIKRSHIEGHYAYGSAVFDISNGSNLNLESSYVTGNGDNTKPGNSYPIGVYSGSSARIAYSTIADNYAPDNNATIVNNSSHLAIYSSIIHEQSNAMALVNSNVLSSEIDCLIVNKRGYINDPRTIEADPEFVDRANNNYKLNAAISPAVDYCDNSHVQTSLPDTDREHRGWDDYSVTNVYGAYDVGADESYDNDIIFKDDFQ